jgi:hypothetical protein
MPLGRGIVELFEAIPGRIEVSGVEPTWRVTGGSFDSVLSWANDAFDEPVVIAREDHSRWWPRVTVTVTTDPELAAGAPPLDVFTEPDRPAHDEPVDTPVVEPPTDDVPLSPLEDIFARQEEARLARLPEQRSERRKTS